MILYNIVFETILAFYLIKPKPSKNDTTTNETAIIVVNLFKPDSAPFWLEKIWDAPPIAAIPSPFGECKALFKHLGKPEKLTVKTYEDAHHGFDIPELPSEIELDFGTFGYNETAANAAWVEVTNFLKR